MIPRERCSRPRVSPDEDGSHYRAVTIVLATAGIPPGMGIDEIQKSRERLDEEAGISFRIAFELQVD